MIGPTEHNCGFQNGFNFIRKTGENWQYVTEGVPTNISFCPFCGIDLTPGEYSIGSSLIAAERVRQVQVEGWNAAHDDQWDDFQLSYASISYTISAIGIHLIFMPWEKFFNNPEWWWPFDLQWLKPKTRMKDLVRAGAFLCAEIDRLWRTGERLEGKQ